MIVFAITFKKGKFIFLSKYSNMNWYKISQQVFYGFKVVAYNPQTKEAYSLWGGKSVPINIQIGNISTSNSQNGIYLGYPKDFCMNYYAGGTDGEELLLTYEFGANDVLNKNILPDINGSNEQEIRVKKAKLVKIEHIQKDDDIATGLSDY